MRDFKALLALTFTALAAAVPYPRDSLRDNGFGYLKPEECSEYCGADNELCCSGDESCFTSSGVPTCTTGLAHTIIGRDFTTTWTETRTFTSTISSWYVPTTTVGVGIGGQPCVPPEGSGQIACGPICCANWQFCAFDGQCEANPGFSTFTEVVTTGVYVTTQFSAPLRPTSGTATQTQTTGTFASETNPAASSTNTSGVSTTSGQLSGGAIAGIVIGTIAGVVLLVLLCFCCIARGLWHTIVGAFGGAGAGAAAAGAGGRKSHGTERIITEKRYSRHGTHVGMSGHGGYGAGGGGGGGGGGAISGGRTTHSRWFGVGGGGRPSGAAARKEKKSGEGMAWILTAIGAIAILLGLRSSDKRKTRNSSNSSNQYDWSSSYYSTDYTQTSPSSRSSDRRTRRSRQSRQSRRSRQSRGTRTSTRPSRG